MWKINQIINDGAAARSQCKIKSIYTYVKKHQERWSVEQRSPIITCSIKESQLVQYKSISTGISTFHILFNRYYQHTKVIFLPGSWNVNTICILRLSMTILISVSAVYSCFWNYCNSQAAFVYIRRLLRSIC